MYTPSHIRAVIIVSDPPHIAITPTLQQCITSFFKFFWVTLLADVIHCSFRNNLQPIHVAIISQEFAKTC